MNDDIERLYPYTDADVERVNASQIREGQLMAFRGPVGSGRWLGSRVVVAHYNGSAGVGGEKFLITYWHVFSGKELSLDQPESMPVCRIRKDRVKRSAA